MLKATKLAQIKAPKSNAKAHNPATEICSEKIIVVGAGPVGMRFVHRLLFCRPLAKVTLFGDEACKPYNRIQLSALLAGDIPFDEIITSLPNPSLHQSFTHIATAISKIDTTEKRVYDAHGVAYAYDTLVIATGSRPHIPNIPGVCQEGVFTFRNMRDAESLFARTSRARHIVVVGGGLLGLESARALLRFNTRVTLIHQSAWLMNRQLDQQSADLLQQRIHDLGIEAIVNTGVRKITGDGRVTGIQTRDKRFIECDTVLLCTGIKPNMEIAREAGIAVHRGILVDDRLATSADGVYAIGECCEHRKSLYGLVNPGYEQAAVLADRLNGGDSRYTGSLEISRLKVVGEQVCSMGEVSEVRKRPLLRELRFTDKKKNIYRKIVLHRGKLIGAVSVGDWEEARRVQEVFQRGRRLWPWQTLRFITHGHIFSSAQDEDVHQWPRTAVICQCQQITQGQLVDAIAAGHRTATELKTVSGASSVCGSCRPLLDKLCRHEGQPEQAKNGTLLLTVSIVVMIMSFLFVSSPELKPSESVRSQDTLEQFWNDKFWKQVSGFSLLGISVLGMLMSLRKRIKFFRLGDFAYWRLAHALVGVVCIILLLLHTGLSLGNNFNRLLAINFFAILALGAISALTVSLSHKMSTLARVRYQRGMTWTHIVLTWPLPALLIFHILSVYYF